MTYGRIAQCELYANNRSQSRWYKANLQDNCISLAKWVNVSQQQGKLQTSLRLYTLFTFIYFNELVI